jgi:predicted CoA-binding protein
LSAYQNPSDAILKEIYSKYKNVAIIGLSDNPSRPSYVVAEYLKNHGFNIIPVNPFVAEVLGEKSYKSLMEMPIEIQKTVEIVDIFRRSEEVLPIIEQAVQLKKSRRIPHVVWMQLGVINEQAAKLAQEAGLTVVMDKCIRLEHQRLYKGNRRSE